MRQCHCCPKPIASNVFFSLFHNNYNWNDSEAKYCISTESAVAVQFIWTKLLYETKVGWTKHIQDIDENKRVHRKNYETEGKKY